MKSNKGITLVALVITIIVLLILAGVSISLVVGDNGVLTQAGDAADKTDLASAESALELTLSSVYSNFMSNVWNDDVTAKIADNVTVAELDKELQNNGYYIVKFGDDSKVTSDETTNIAGDASGDSTSGYTTSITICAGKPGTAPTSAAGHKNSEKHTTYTGKLKWSGTIVTVEEELKIDESVVQVK